MKPQGIDPGRPGLESVADERRGLHPKTHEDILSIREAVREADTAYVMKSTPTSVAPLARARFLIGEISATLELHFDDGVEDERDAQLDAVETAHANTPESTDAAAAELESYADLANEYRKEIDGVGGFDAAYIDEAKALAAELRNRPAVPQAKSDEAIQALALRNRLATLLQTRLGLVRGAARFVFRNHPDLVRLATSAYERRRRAAARRKAPKKDAQPPAEPK